jgi:hypothetical protein
MDRKNIAGLNQLKKKQRAAIGQLGSEWAVLHSAENLLFKLMDTHYGLVQPGMRHPPELVKLEKEQWEIFERKREISADLVQLEEGLVPRKRKPGRKNNVIVMARNMFIRASENRGDREIARELDLHLAQGDGMPPLGLPESWTEKYGVKSYYEAYRHRKCKPLVQKLISVAKAA